ncbi:15835_t:CDS:2, partial [Racocetra persica]
VTEVPKVIEANPKVSKDLKLAEEDAKVVKNHQEANSLKSRISKPKSRDKNASVMAPFKPPINPNSPLFNSYRKNKRSLSDISNNIIIKLPAKKEKVATLVKKLREEIKILVNELNEKNNKIKELEEKYINLNTKYHALKKDHDTGDGYYTESRRLLESENAVLMRRNLEFFEEIEATKIRNSELENNLHLLQQQNVELSKEIATLSE